jgi:hypothetical protein
MTLNVNLNLNKITIIALSFGTWYNNGNGKLEFNKS